MIFYANEKQVPMISKLLTVLREILKSKAEMIETEKFFYGRLYYTLCIFYCIAIYLLGLFGLDRYLFYTESVLDRVHCYFIG